MMVVDGKTTNNSTVMKTNMVEGVPYDTIDLSLPLYLLECSLQPMSNATWIYHVLQYIHIYIYICSTSSNGIHSLVSHSLTTLRVARSFRFSFDTSGSRIRCFSSTFFISFYITCSVCVALRLSFSLCKSLCKHISVLSFYFKKLPL